MTANKPMTGEQMDELMTVAVKMQRDAETDCNRPSAMFAYAVQVAVLELRKVRSDVAALAAENAGLKDFVKTCFRAAADGASLDGADIQELGERLGLFGRETYQPVLHGYICGHEAGEDSVYVMKETPATDAFLAEVRAQGVTEYASKRGFSFQHGSIHAHFGNGDVMVGAVTFENGDAGINFAPVREKTGGVGTSYEWTRGKTAEQVDSVFVIASSSAEGLEVIRDKLNESIAQLRKGGAA